MAATSHSGTTLMPARKRFRLRFIFIPALIGMLPLAGYFGWGWRADRTLQKQITALRAAGEHVLQEDFEPKSDFNAPPNGAKDLLTAAAILDDETVHNASVAYVPTTMPVDERAWPYLADAIQWFEPALQRIALAQSKPRCEFEHRWRFPLSENRETEELTGNRNLVDLLIAAALVEHHRGQDHLVIRRLDQMLFLASATERSPGLRSHLAGLGIVHRVARRVEQLAPDLKIAGDASGASPGDLRKVIAQLLDEIVSDAAWRNVWRDERLLGLDRNQAILQGKAQVFAPSSSAMPWLGPIYQQMALDQFNHDTHIARALDGVTDGQNARARLMAVPHLPKHTMASDQILYTKNDADWHFETATDRRLAATALAIRLYQTDHAGARPSRLDDLLPSYLPAVPRDAMSADLRPIGYLPRAEHPVLYSVGVDGVDHHADESPVPGEYGYIDEWERVDRVFYLSNRIRPELYVPRPDSPNGNGVMAGYYSDGPAPWEPRPEPTSGPYAPASPPAYPAAP
jgi:hypothetical protein